MSQPAITHVKVYSPFQTYFDGDALSVTGANDTGAFDVLPHHHNFLTLLSAGILEVRTAAGSKKFQITRGLMHVKADKVIVFLDV